MRKWSQNFVIVILSPFMFLKVLKINEYTIEYVSFQLCKILQRILNDGFADKKCKQYKSKIGDICISNVILLQWYLL